MHPLWGFTASGLGCFCFVSVWVSLCICGFRGKKLIDIYIKNLRADPDSFHFLNGYLLKREFFIGKCINHASTSNLAYTNAKPSLCDTPLASFSHPLLNTSPHSSEHLARFMLPRHSIFSFIKGIKHTTIIFKPFSKSPTQATGTVRISSASLLRKWTKFTHCVSIFPNHREGHFKSTVEYKIMLKNKSNRTAKFPNQKPKF